MDTDFIQHLFNVSVRFKSLILTKQLKQRILILHHNFKCFFLILADCSSIFSSSHWPPQSSRLPTFPCHLDFWHPPWKHHTLSVHTHTHPPQLYKQPQLKGESWQLQDVVRCVAAGHRGLRSLCEPLWVCRKLGWKLRQPHCAGAAGAAGGWVSFI